MHILKKGRKKNKLVWDESDERWKWWWSSQTHYSRWRKLAPKITYCCSYIMGTILFVSGNKEICGLSVRVLILLFSRYYYQHHNSAKYPDIICLILSVGRGKDLRRLHYRKLIADLHLKGKSVSNLLVWDKNS